MTLTLLLDLDETLLQTNQDKFVPAYFQALTTSFAKYKDLKTIMQALVSSTEKMSQSQDVSRTLKDVFIDEFCPQVGISLEELDAHIDDFYSRVFPTLQSVTAQNPHAKPFIDWATKQGFRLVVATDPLLPRAATYQRVQWAGFDPQQFELISTFDDFHFSKNFSSYYAEVLGRIGWPDGPVLMVGNDYEKDIVPAKKLGLATFFVEEGPGSTSKPEAGPHGSLSDLRRYIESADLSSFVPSFKSKESILSIHASTPAVMNGLLNPIQSENWKQKPSSGEWTMTELICHLRDTEREIHHMQLNLFNGKDEPFIPRPDTGVWASQRDYLHEDGPSSLKEFVAARSETLDILKSISEGAWERKARHAIFGPTNFREVAGFMADHDRLHIQQAWSLKNRLQ